MHKRLWQSKSFIPFNHGKPWSSYSEMFQHDPNWNGTMSRGGWIIHNIHLLDELINMALVEYYDIVNGPESNYFNKRKWSVKAYYAAKAHEFLEHDPTLTAPQLTGTC